MLETPQGRITAVTRPEHYQLSEQLLEHAAAILSTDVAPEDRAELIQRQAAVASMAPHTRSRCRGHARTRLAPRPPRRTRLERHRRNPRRRLTGASRAVYEPEIVRCPRDRRYNGHDSASAVGVVAVPEEPPDLIMHRRPPGLAAPEASHLTLTWPRRALRAAGQSHGSHVIVTVPGLQGWRSRHSAGQIATGTLSVKHIFEYLRCPRTLHGHRHDMRRCGIHATRENIRLALLFAIIVILCVC
jgi:hypothetical protein